MTKTAEKPYPLGPHIPTVYYYSPYNGVPPPTPGHSAVRPNNKVCENQYLLVQAHTVLISHVKCLLGPSHSALNNMFSKS